MIDMIKKYRTRDGREVRIYATDGGKDGEHRVHGAIKWDWGWGVCVWYSHGGYLCSVGNPRDLIEVKPRIKREVWVNVYPNTQTIHSTLDSAHLNGKVNRVACVKLVIDCEEGEGL